MKELGYHRGFLIAVDKKLMNAKFIASAPPAVIELEKRKKADAESKIKMLEKNLSRLLTS